MKSKKTKQPAVGLKELGLGQDMRPASGGWAPGDYQNTCTCCGTQFLGDKRAVVCADCQLGEAADESKKPRAPHKTRVRLQRAGSPSEPRWGVMRASSGRVIILVPTYCAQEERTVQGKAHVSRETAERLLRELAGALKENVLLTDETPAARAHETK